MHSATAMALIPAQGHSERLLSQPRAQSLLLRFPQNLGVVHQRGRARQLLQLPQRHAAQHGAKFRMARPFGEKRQ